MPKYEYRVVTGGTAAIAHLNERINAMAEEGWEVVTISGNETVNVLLRRPRPEASQSQGGSSAPPSQQS
jgi:hypothetical protein